MNHASFLDRVRQKGATTSTDHASFQHAVVVRPVGASEGGFTPDVSESHIAAVAARLGFEKPQHVGFGLYVVVQWVTPAHAVTVLAGLAGVDLNEGNRNANIQHAHRIALDIDSAHWALTHQGAAFDKDGNLLDGQHRFKAILDSGKAVPMMITFNVSKEAQRVIDTHQKRTAADIMTIATGSEFPSSWTTVVKRAVIGERQSVAFTNSQMAELIMEYMEALRWVMQRFPRKGLANIRVAPVLAALVRAFFHYNHKRLAQFIHILVEGHTDGIPFPKAAVELRKRLTDEARKDEVKRFLLTLQAIKLFCANEDTADLRVPRSVPFDLPGSPVYAEVWATHGDPSEPLRDEVPEPQHNGSAVGEEGGDGAGVNDRP